MRERFANRVIDAAWKCLYTNPELASKKLAFISSFLSLGKRLQPETLERLKGTVLKKFPEGRRGNVGETLDNELAFLPRVVGRWNANVYSNVLDWPAERIAIALTAMVAPSFFNLRPDDFLNGTTHLTEMTLRYEAVSEFVSLTILKAAAVGLAPAVTMATHWIEVATHLIAELHNYHMGSAVQAGMAKHYVERLKPLWEALPSAVAKKKLFLDVMCSAEARMAGLRTAQEEAKAKRVAGMIPAMYWLVQKTELLRETPLLHNHALNPYYFLSAGKIFGDLAKMQELRYPSGLLVEDEVFFTFMQLERQPRCDEDAMSELSDRAREKLSLNSGPPPNRTLRDKLFSPKHSARNQGY
jgi:hypothetical protein